MRRSRLVAAVPFLILLAAPAAQAQEASLFENSWFWGVHAGATSIGTPTRSTTQAGTIGAEWMITRSTGGLYVAYDQAKFDGASTIADNSTTPGSRAVSISDMRTISIAAVAFPFHLSNLRPYAGLGFAINTIITATPQADSSGAAPSDAGQRTDDARSRSGVFVMGGAQWQIRRVALFGQVSASPSDRQFLVTKPITTITGGVRYNFGSSIEK